MTRLASSYCIVGPGPFAPRQEAFRQTVQYSLEDSAAFYRAQAKQAARVSADEAEAPNTKAAILEAALVVLLEDGVPLAVTLPQPKAAPPEHTCDFPACGAPASNAFGMRDEVLLWACQEHARQVEATWLAARAEKERRAREILETASTSMAGVPGYLT